MPSRAVILVSGGLDSAVALACGRRDGHACHAISFDYGQRHRCELDAAVRVARSLGVPPERHAVVRVDLRAVGGSALTADIDVPKDRDESAMNAGVPITYVPARNLTFLSLAAGYAETVGAQHLYLGVNAVDYSGYPDCRDEFVEAFERAANLGTKAGSEGRRLSVHRPLVHLTKPDIIRLGLSLGVDFGLTHSCYDPVEGRPCGHCDSCLIRAKGFADAGVPDPALARRSRDAKNARPEPFRIRRTVEGDLAAIFEIYHEQVLHGIATFDTHPRSPEQQREWFLRHSPPQYPALVAVDAAGTIIGWATLTPWSDRKAYDRTAEVSEYVRADHRARGVGSALLHALIDHARAHGLKTLLARMADANPASVRLHEAAGFTTIGVMSRVGEKFGRVLDVRMMQRGVE
jgi:7-cyano-7-deazaguanine synthase